MSEDCRRTLKQEDCPDCRRLILIIKAFFSQFESLPFLSLQKYLLRKIDAPSVKMKIYHRFLNLLYGRPTANFVLLWGRLALFTQS